MKRHSLEAFISIHTTLSFFHAFAFCFWHFFFIYKLLHDIAFFLYLLIHDGKLIILYIHTVIIFMKKKKKKKKTKKFY